MPQELANHAADDLATSEHSLNDSGASFPTKKLVLPAIPSFAIIGFSWLADALGHQWNVHGDMALVFMLFLACTLVAFVIQALMLAFAIPHLLRHPEERTTVNLMSVAFAGACVLACLGLVTAAISAASTA